MSINTIRVFDEGQIIAPLMQYPSFAAFWAAWRSKLPTLYWSIREGMNGAAAGYQTLLDGQCVRVIELHAMPTSEFDSLRVAHEMLHFALWKMGYPGANSVAKRVPLVDNLCKTLGSMFTDPLINNELLRFYPHLNALTVAHDIDVAREAVQQGSKDGYTGYERVNHLLWLVYCELRWRMNAGGATLPSLAVYRANNPTIAAEADKLIDELMQHFPFNPSAQGEMLVELIKRYDLHKLMIAPTTLETSAGWTDGSPNATQRQAIGNALGMFQDAWNYKALLLYGSQGGLMTGDKDASPVQWTPINLASQVSQTWSHPIELTSSEGGFSPINDPISSQPRGTYSAGSGYTSVYDSPPANTLLDIELILPAGAALTSVRVIGTAGVATASQNVRYVKYDNVQRGNLPLGSGAFDTTVSYTQSGVTSVQIGVSTEANAASTNTITRVVIRGTGANPFGGGVSSGNETFVGNLTFSINRQGWAGWLSDDETNIRFVSTKSYFQSNVAVTLCGTADSAQGYVQNVTTGSYNNPDGTGVIFAAAGSAIMKSTNWGSSWSTLHYLSPGGGLANVGYATTAGAANSGTSPEYTYVVGNIGGGSVGFRRANGATAIVNTAGNVPLTAQCLVSFTTNSSYLFLGAGTVCYYSDSAGSAWQATYPGGTIWGVSGSSQNHLFCLAYGPSLLAYTVDGGANWTDLNTSYRAFADSTYGAGTALNIVTACVDLSVMYQNPVTN